MTRKNAKRKYKEGANLQGPTERKALRQVELGEVSHYDLHELQRERERQMAAATPELHSTRTPIKGAKTLGRLKAIANTHEIAPHELESLPVDAPPALKPKDLPVIESDMPPVVSEELQRANQLHQLAMAGDSDGPMLESSFIVAGTHDNASRVRDFPECEEFVIPERPKAPMPKDVGEFLRQKAESREKNVGNSASSSNWLVNLHAKYGNAC